MNHITGSHGPWIQRWKCGKWNEGNSLGVVASLNFFQPLLVIVSFSWAASHYMYCYHFGKALLTIATIFLTLLNSINVTCCTDTNLLSAQNSKVVLLWLHSHCWEVNHVPAFSMWRFQCQQYMGNSQGLKFMRSSRGEFFWAWTWELHMFI